MEKEHTKHTLAFNLHLHMAGEYGITHITAIKAAIKAANAW